MRTRYRLRAVPVGGGSNPDVLATVGLTTGTACFHLALPEGAATGGVQVGSLDTQTDIKNTWPGGSIRDCQVSCVVPSNGNYEIKEGPATSGTFTPTWPTASVAFVIGSDTYTATLPSLTTTDPWFVGPHVKEYRVVVTPLNGATPHPHLIVKFDVRSYSAGGHRVDVHVYSPKDVSTNNLITYDVTITINGSTVFTQNAASHYIFLFWRQKFLVGTPSISTVTPDFEPFHLAKAFPRFLSTVSNPTWVTTGSGSGYDFGFFKWGHMAGYMMQPGGRAEIGPFPFWVAQYIIHKGATQLAALLTHADLIGSWPLAVTKADGSILRLGDNVHENYWLDGRSGATDGVNGPAVARDFTGGLQGRSPDAEPDCQHFPGIVYPAYMITGDRFYCDAMKITAAWAMISTYPGDSKGYLGTSFDRTWAGVGHGLLTTQGDRGFGWALRELVNAATYLPSADTDKQYFVDRMEDNLAWFTYYRNNRSTLHPITEFVLWDRGDGNLPPDYWFDLAIWKQSYLAWALDWAKDQGFSTTDSLWFRDQVIKTQIKFLNSSGEGYPTEFGVPYVPRVAKRAGPVPNTIHYFEDMGIVWDFNHGDDSGYPPENTVPGQRLPQPINGYYGPEARILLKMGVREGLTGASTADAWLAAVSGHIDDVNGRSGFAITW